MSVETFHGGLNGTDVEVLSCAQMAVGPCLGSLFMTPEQVEDMRDAGIQVDYDGPCVEVIVTGIAGTENSAYLVLSPVAAREMSRALRMAADAAVRP